MLHPAFDRPLDPRLVPSCRCVDLRQDCGCRVPAAAGRDAFSAWNDVTERVICPATRLLLLFVLLRLLLLASIDLLTESIPSPSAGLSHSACDADLQAVVCVLLASVARNSVSGFPSSSSSCDSCCRRCCCLRFVHSSLLASPLSGYCCDLCSPARAWLLHAS